MSNTEKDHLPIGDDTDTKLDFDWDVETLTSEDARVSCLGDTDELTSPLNWACSIGKDLNAKHTEI